MASKIIKLDKLNIFRTMELPEKGHVETKCYLTWMGSDGIARTQVKSGARIELSDAKENSEIVNGLSNLPEFPLIVDTREVLSITKEARDHFSLRGRSSKICGIAIIRSSSLSNVVANFFIGLNRPVVPVKLFSNERDAIKWCEAFIKK
jgi:hypothetical protein